MTLSAKTNLLAVALLIALADSSQAQAWAGAEPGVRISIHTHDSTLAEPFSRDNAIVGVVVAREPSMLFIQVTRHDTLRVPVSSIDRAFVSRGISRRKNVLRTGALEALIFAALPPAAGERYYSSEHFREIGFAAAVGGVLGALIAPERWHRLKP